MTPHALSSKIKGTGLRLTSARIKIANIISRAGKPLSVVQIMKHLSVNKTTVYREMTSLIKKGLITEVDLCDGIRRYESSTRDHHHHLVCLNCRSITEVDINDDFSKVEELIKEKNKFQVIKHNLEFFGYCRNCSE